MHHAITVGERAIATGAPIPVAKKMAMETFEWYWSPANIEAICDPVPSDGWLPLQNRTSLQNKGLDVLGKYFDVMKFSDDELLATEYSFMVPIVGTWDEELEEPHVLAGSVDRLAVGYYRRNETVKVEDYKFLLATVASRRGRGPGTARQPFGPGNWFWSFSAPRPCGLPSGSVLDARDLRAVPHTADPAAERSPGWVQVERAALGSPAASADLACSS